MENKDITVIEKKEHPVITQEKIISYLDSFGLTSQLESKEKIQFVTIAVTYQLDPFKREIYCIPYKGADGSRKLSIITGYEVYLKRAERTADLVGWNVITEGTVKEGNMKAIITIHRKSWTQPLKHEVDFNEYNLGTKIWQEKPKTMIKKVAIAQGFRLAFPDEFGGMPYTADELPVEMTISESKDVPAAPERKSAAHEPTPEELEAIRKKKAEDYAKTNPMGQMAPPASKDAPAKPQAPQNEVLTASGKILFHNLPKSGGKSKYHTFVLDGYKGKYFATNDAILIETLAEKLESKELATIEYIETINGQYTNRNIIGLIAQK